MKQFIMVAGIDHRKFTLDFGKICIDRVLELHEQFHQKDDLLFTIFDFKAGTIAEVKASKQSGAITAPRIISQFKPISIADYPPSSIGRLATKKRMIGRLSMSDVYKKIIDIGSSSPGELIELSFFTADESSVFLSVVNQNLGSLLLSAKEKKLEKENFRIKGDIEFSYFLDFGPPRMSETERESFDKAFSSEGYIWLWGGYQPIVEDDTREFEALYELVELVLNDPGYKKSKVSDRTIFTFPKVSNELFEILQREVGYDFDLILNRRDLRLPFGYIKKLVYDELDYKSTIYVLFEELEIKIYGLVSPVPMEREKDRPYNLFRAPDRYKKYIEFFRDEFGLEFEPDRYYSIIDSGFEDYDGPLIDEIDFFPAKSKKPPVKQPVDPKPPEPPQPPATIPTSFPASQPSTQPVTPPASRPTTVPAASQPVSQPPTTEKTIEQKEYVFVAGVDYKISRKLKINFREMAVNRIKKIAAEKAPDERLHFTLLDFASGKIISYYINEAGEVRTTVDKTFHAVSLSDYKTEADENDEQVGFFQETKNKIIGMDDAFDRIIEIGKAGPGTLIEFSIFSHGTEFRPRTLHFIPPAPFTEKPDPVTWRFYDPYIPFDFSSVMMSKIEKELFAKAFHASGYSWIWGFETSNDLKKLINSIIDSRDYKAGISFDTVIKLKTGDRLLRRMVDQLTGKDPGPRVVKSPFGFLIRVIATQLKSSYMHHLAKATGKPVFGGLPGVTAKTETGQFHNLMSIDQTAFKKYNQFFKDNFQFDFDTEKRGYGKYVSTNKWNITDYPGSEFDSFFTEEITEQANS